MRSSCIASPGVGGAAFGKESIGGFGTQPGHYGPYDGIAGSHNLNVNIALVHGGALPSRLAFLAGRPQRGGVAADSSLYAVPVLGCLFWNRSDLVPAPLSIHDCVFSTLFLVGFNGNHKKNNLFWGVPCFETHPHGSTVKPRMAKRM